MTIDELITKIHARQALLLLEWEKLFEELGRTYMSYRTNPSAYSVTSRAEEIEAKQAEHKRLEDLIYHIERERDRSV